MWHTVCSMVIECFCGGLNSNPQPFIRTDPLRKAATGRSISTLGVTYGRVTTVRVMKNRSLVRLCFSLCIALIVGLYAGTSSAQTAQRPWLAPAKPTLIDWVILELQANESDHDFGENDLTITFHGGPKSDREGVIYCQIRYLPTASVEVVQMVERGIRERFEFTKRTYPWTKLEIRTEVARPIGKQ